MNVEHNTKKHIRDESKKLLTKRKQVPKNEIRESKKNPRTKRELPEPILVKISYLLL
jgi:hypothetical protein